MGLSLAELKGNTQSGTVTFLASADPDLRQPTDYQSISLSPAMADTGFEIRLETVSGDGEAYAFDRATNGFKIGYNGSDAATIRWTAGYPRSHEGSAT